MNALKKITTRAKQLQKKHPNSKWVSLVKKAGAEYRAGTLGKVRKPAKKKVAKKKRAAARVVRSVPRKKITTQKKVEVQIGSASHHESMARKAHLQSLGKLESQKFMARTKTLKRQIGKKITLVKQKLNRLK